MIRKTKELFFMIIWCVREDFRCWGAKRDGKLGNCFLLMLVLPRRKKFMGRRRKFNRIRRWTPNEPYFLRQLTSLGRECLVYPRTFFGPTVMTSTRTPLLRENIILNTHNLWWFGKGNGNRRCWTNLWETLVLIFISRARHCTHISRPENFKYLSNKSESWRKDIELCRLALKRVRNVNLSAWKRYVHRRLTNLATEAILIWNHCCKTVDVEEGS